MKQYKKIVAFLMSIILAFSVFTITSFADGYGEQIINVGEAKKFATYYPGAIDNLGNYVNLKKFSKYLYNEIYECSKKISVSSYSIPASTTTLDGIWSLIEDEMYELFHITKLSATRNSKGYIDYLVPTYDYTEKEFKSMYAKAIARAEELVEGIKGNTNLSDVEKALLLHDRVALNCEYDYANYLSNTLPWKSYHMYGALVDGVAVCQGYAEAYGYLLELVGVKSEICTSVSLNHAWNIVYIDGEKYHVDVTWDDPSSGWNVKGNVNHDNFLLSSYALLLGVNGEGGHTAYDYDFSPRNTKYDNYFWQNSNTAFYLLGDEIYYIDNENATLNRYSDRRPFLSVDDVWIGAGNYNYAKLACDGESLYCSTSRSIYKINPLTYQSTELFTLSDSVTNKSLYGLSYENGGFSYDISNKPDAEVMTRKHQVYDVVAPKLTVYSTNNIAKKQTVTVSFSDASKIKGYWWGQNSNYTENSFTAVSSNNDIKKTVSKKGYYYITAVDEFGNVSDTYRIIYRKTTLDYNGGNGNPDYLITLNNKKITLPTPVKGGYIFKGWISGNSSAVTTLTPKADNTYKAVWQINKKPALYNIGGVLYYYTNGVVNKSDTLCLHTDGKWYHVKGGKRVYDTTLVKYNNKWYYVKNGVKNTSNTLVNYKNKWYHVKGGKRVYDTTLVKYNNKWYYVKNGVKNTSNTLVNYKNKWYHVKGGKRVYNTSLVKYNNKWYYVKNGVKNTSNTLVRYNNKLYHVKGGKRVYDTSIVKYKNRRYYVKDGIVRLVNKTVKISGKKYKIKNGVVVG